MPAKPARQPSPSPVRSSPIAEGDLANLDFLAEASAVVVNLVPDKNGVIKLPRNVVGNCDDYAWWTQCAKRLESGAVARGLGLLKEARCTQVIKNPGGMLTWLFKKIARGYGVSLNRLRPLQPEGVQIGFGPVSTKSTTLSHL